MKLETEVYSLLPGRSMHTDLAAAREVAWALPVSCCLLSYFPGSRAAALAGAWPELLIADRVRAAGGCAVSRLDPRMHQANANLQEHACPLLLVAPTLPGDPKGKVMSSTIHPLALQPSQSGSGLLQAPHAVWQGGSRAVLPSTNPIKRSTVLSCSSKL